MAPDRPASDGRVLVVDDQEANVRLLERILAREAQLTVRSTTDAREALGMAASEPPDLIMLDLHMPHLDGFAVLEQLAPLREREGFLPVLVLTADAEPSARRRALTLGATDYVTKPFDADEVLLRCRNLLHARALYRAVAEHGREIEGKLTQARSTHDVVMGALNRLRQDATLEERAAAFVDELGRAAEFDAVSVLAITADQQVIPVAVGGTDLFGAVSGRPLPAARAAILIDRLRGGGAACALSASDGALRPSKRLRSAWYVPIAEDGRTLGAFVAAGRCEPNEASLARGMSLATELGAIARAVVGSALAARYAEGESRRRIQKILQTRAFSPVFQPVVDIRSRDVIGFEALTRFADGARPDLRFAEAHRVGLGLPLEDETLAAAVGAADELPHSAWLSVNASPDLLLDAGRLARTIAGSRRMIVVEITEHVAIQDYAILRGALESLGSNVRVAIDDAGAGFASFRHVLELAPDFVKLDADLVRGIERDPSRQALVVGMRYFAQKTGCTLIAEGIETEEEREMLESLEIRFGQGYLLRRPAPAAELNAGLLV